MQYVKLTISFLFAFCAFVLPQSVSATAYYVDFTPNIANGNGLATTTPFNNLDSFTETARSPGDIAFVRRNTASTTNVSDLNFTSDGTIANPIIISADNDNLWNDASTTAQTYTVAVATSTFTASATITGVQAGDWFYVAGDCTQTYNSTSLNQCEYFYEVESVSGTQLRLYLPYKGDQTGSGLSLVNLGKNPQWNVASGDFQWNFDTDDYWSIKGMDIRGTDVNGNVEIDSSVGHLFADSIFTGNGASDFGIEMTDDGFYIKLKKSRTFNLQSGIAPFTVDLYGTIIADDSIFDGNSVANSLGIDRGPVTSSKIDVILSNSFFRRNATADLEGTLGADGSNIARNVYLNSTTEINTIASQTFGRFFFEDYDGTLSLNRQNIVGAGNVFISALALSTSTIRSGGGPTAMEVRPTSNTTSIWDFNKIKLFEYPIYTNTSSKQYDMYFKVATNTAEFTTDPTAEQFWIECEYWAHNTGATSTRKIKKSTGVLDFNGSSSWQNLSVACQPTQSGILYLRGWYAKPLESGGQTNIFLMDNTPVIN